MYFRINYEIPEIKKQKKTTFKGMPFEGLKSLPCSLPFRPEAMAVVAPVTV
jgi:hypothetical protein